MPKYNDKFELSVADVDLIEEALRQTKRSLAVRAIDATDADVTPRDTDQDDTVRQIHDLLGRLHNQKVFYRPQSGAYIGG
ncbi:hypothetical protein EI983_05960 [Roseovarius faecimaris]|uniref:Uncharacterized protein n=1 Tax=Roseovarius faecimaris TaxID=2494550 RepID=A0A6I6IPV0_9RHOB|nr:hypothetical protein [Roseovarius faecimaris]QGX97843.1 hypothetical protein EI983_05960 [Roseovarius faecimaris]